MHLEEAREREKTAVQTKMVGALKRTCAWSGLLKISMQHTQTLSVLGSLPFVTVEDTREFKQGTTELKVNENVTSK